MHLHYPEGCSGDGNIQNLVLISNCYPICACICITTGGVLFENVIKVKFGRVELVAVFLNLFYLCFKKYNELTICVINTSLLTSKVLCKT